ncbi:hypothetical protein TNCT_380511 [Trichonephila clavata]|uniref:Uncharacterized protein n=1 Tax=Trichonephila clavata TaxID=2740835 RepID=A0A8X6GHM4_TRICU|nr:hypothetical protein TNCT_380511 [Trichonephila clavata]
MIVREEGEKGMIFSEAPLHLEARYLSWLERRANNAKVAGSIPSRARLFTSLIDDCQRRKEKSNYILRSSIASRGPLSQLVRASCQ